MAYLRAWANTTTTASAVSFPPKLRYRPKTGEMHIVPAGARDSDAITLPVGIKLILDWQRFREGEHRFTPWDDSRMVLRGTPVPPPSGDPDYDGAVQLPILAQGYGVAMLTSASANMIKAVDQLHDNYVRSVEAAGGQLPLYRLDPPRSYTSRFTGELLFVPVLALTGWVSRDPSTFGKVLIPAPVPQSSGVAIATPTTAPGSAGNELFRAATRTGAVMPPTPTTAAPRPAAAPSRERLVPAGDDLDDVIPF